MLDYMRNGKQVHVMFRKYFPDLLETLVSSYVHLVEILFEHPNSFNAVSGRNETAAISGKTG